MERALLVTVDLGEPEGWTAEERSLELRELASSAGAKVIEEIIVRRHEPQPACFIGTGKVEEISAICAKQHIGIVIFNNDLSATQQKNIEERVKTKTIDRTQLILDIFARHAHSNEGKIQVELAQLLYLLPRLTGKGIHLSRLGGGIGTRGPGEQKLEVDRRRIRDRISHLKKSLEGLSRRRAMMRKKREKFSILAVAIIGYTNVGKSTLLNALTHSKVIVEDKLFSTLDSTVRKLIMPNKQKVLFIDTVGFLNHLPHHLIEAFRATLEEVKEADLLLHLVDVSHQKAEEQADAVYDVLKDIGADDKPVITAFNKIDKLGLCSIPDRLKGSFHDAVPISAVTGEGLDELVKRILHHIKGCMASIKLRLPASDGASLNMIYENGLVIKKEYTGNEIEIEAEIPSRIKDILYKKS